MNPDKVQPEEFLGDRVLDLEPGVRFDEGVVAVWCRCATSIDEKFDSAEPGVAEASGQPHSIASEPFAQFGMQRRRRRNLDQFLVRPLDGTVPFPEVGDRTCPITGDLDLDVPGVGHALFHVDRRVAERAERF